MSPNNKIAPLALPLSKVVLVPTPRDAWPKTITLEDCFWKKSSEKIVEATPHFEYIDSESLDDESSETLDSLRNPIQR